MGGRRSVEMTGFGIIDPSCTTEDYVNGITALEVARRNRRERIDIMQLSDEQWRFILSAERLPLCMATSISLIFGYQVGITSTVSTMDSFLSAFFQNDHDHIDDRRPFSKFNRPGLSLFTSSFYTAALAAWLIAPWVLKIIRRPKRIMVASSICLLLGATLTCLATTLTILVGGRMLLGSATGLSLHVMPIYVSKIAPMNPRILFHVFQLAVTAGVSWASQVDELGWRTALGIAILPALAALVSSRYLPNIEDVHEEVISNESERQPWRELFLKNRPHLVTATLLPLLYQLSGISLMVLFTPIIFHAMGERKQGTSTMQAASIITVPWTLIRILCEMVFIPPMANIPRRKLVIVFGLVMAILTASSPT